VTLGLAVSAGAIFAPALGAVGDRWGLHATILVTAAVFALATLGMFTLPAAGRRGEQAPLAQTAPA
jgi:MFS family permease